MSNAQPDKQMNPNPLEFRKELIAHLSQEVDTHTKMIFEWRARAGFYWLVGPFVLVGSVLIVTKQVPLFNRLDWWGLAAVVLACFCFIAMGYVGGKMERTMLDQCNDWRTMIHTLTTNSAPVLPHEKIVFKQRVMRAYLYAHFLLLILFLCIIFLVVHSASPSGEERSKTQSAAPASEPTKPD